MACSIKRLRIFAGPNGSGKSTLYDYLVKTHSFHLYFHINPDEIASDLPVALDLTNWPFDFTAEELGAYLDESPFQKRSNVSLNDLICVIGKVISLKKSQNQSISYLSAALAAFIRTKMMKSDSSFSFESVFSHVSKIDEIRIAKEAGYRIYLYYIATSNPVINNERVMNRVELGGHAVPSEKVYERYYRTMDNLYAAVQLSDRAFFFDNSDSNTDGFFSFFAEKKENSLHLQSKNVPPWFDKYIIQKI